MRGCESKSNTAIGFLTVVEHTEYGLFGGYLILNLAGRPVEFHCTTPLKPNRAQKILYGPTLNDFLYGELIGRTLIEHGRICPFVVCTDLEPILAAQPYVSTPLVLVLDDAMQHSTNPTQAAPAGVVNDEEFTETKVYRLDAAHRSGPQLVGFQFGRNRLAAPVAAEAERRALLERFSDWAETFDLVEPFQRIRAAIEEARQAAQ